MNNISRTVFVLDVSGSMCGQKCETLQLSATRVIEDIPEGDYVGVVLFDNKTEVAHKVVQITDNSVREAVKASVPRKYGQSTDIGSGLLKGLDAITCEGISTIGATIILVTDGEDTTGVDYVDWVLPTLLTAKVKVVCIAIGNEADHRLERLSRETNGNIYIASDSNREMAARVIESTIQEVKTSTEMSEALTISVCNDIVTIGQNISKNVVIDPEIGRNTEITVSSEDINNFSIAITAPNGQKYDSSSEELTKNLSLKRFQLKPKITESGVWTINFTKHSNKTMSATVSVKSQALKPNPIQMKAILKDPDLSSQLPALIIAQIVKGTDAVIGAEVVATVDKPDGSQTQIRLENHNNVYINYFTDYSGFGRYNVSVCAKSGSTNYLQPLKRGLSSGKGFVSQFERQQIVGCFKVENLIPKPISDQKLTELSLNTAFNNLALNCGSSDCSFESPAPRNAKAFIRPPVVKRDNQELNEVKKAKESLWDLFLQIKKSVNNSKVSDNEKQLMKTSFEEINSFITSSKPSTVAEVEDYKKKLEEIKVKINY